MPRGRRRSAAGWPPRSARRARVARHTRAWRRRSAASPSERSTATGSRPLGENRLHAVHVSNTVLSAGDQAFLVAQDDPATVGLAQLVGREVVHDLVLLAVDPPLREDDVRVVSARTCEPAQALEQAAAIGPGDVVDRAARMDEVERAADRQIRQDRAHPRDVDAAALGEVLGLLEPLDREIDPDYVMSLLGQKHAIAPLAAAEIDHARPVARELGGFAGQG